MISISGIKNVGERKFKGFLISRILVIVAIVVIPITEFLLFSSTDIFKMNLIPVQYRDIVIYITPWFFSFGWVFMLVLFANRISGSIDALDVHIQVIPTRLKLFYGLNALILLVVFAVPIITPVICILAFASAGYRLATIHTDWDEVERTPIGAIILAIIFAVIPVISSYAVLPDMLEFSQFVWFTYWVPVIPQLYQISLALSTALVYGSLAILIKTGAAEYENARVTSNKKDPINKTNVKIFQVLFFAFLLFLEWKELDLKDVIYLGGFVIVFFITIVNFIKGRNNADFKTYLFGYILTVILYGANLLSWEGLGMEESIKMIVIMISAASYLIIYFIVFLRYNEEE